MSEKNRNNKTSKRKLNVKRIAICGIGVAIILIFAIVIFVCMAKKTEQEAGEEPTNIQGECAESGNASEIAEVSEEFPETAEEESIVGSVVIEEEAADINEITEEDVTEPSEEFAAEPSEEPENDDEEASATQLDLSDPASIVANWETIPAGTVINADNIDFNNLSQYFVAYEISDEVFNYINGKSYQENDYVALSDLRYVKLLHYNFNHELQVGELIVAADLQSDFIGVFMELFMAEYEIASMYLPDRYWTGDPTTTDSASIDVNNTSCFMYRPATGSSKLSKHSYGRAIDINPQQNPYVSYTSGSPVWSHENANDYIDRTTGLPHVITEEDICYQIFTKYGFSWGGAWTNTKDYQHFYK